MKAGVDKTPGDRYDGRNMHRECSGLHASAFKSPLRAWLPALVILATLASCKTAPPSGRGTHSVTWIIPSSLRFQECQRPEKFLSPLPIAAIQKCLAGLENGEVSYRLRRPAQPVLELENPEKAPECLRQSLSQLPVPREVVFQ